MLGQKNKAKAKKAEDTLITIVHSPRLKPIRNARGVVSVEAARPIDKQYLAELAHSDDFIAIVFCYKNYSVDDNPRLSQNESCAVISADKAKQMLRTDELSDDALQAVNIILFSAVSQTFGGFLTDGETDHRYVLSKGSEYAHLS